MFDRFTDRARKVMQLANQEAHRFNYRFIGTEHILLGLVKEGTGVGAHVLKNQGISLPALRAEVEKSVLSAPEAPVPGRLPQTPRARKVVEYAIEEARQLNHNYLGTEHLLLGLLRERDGVAARILTGRRIKLEATRKGVLKLIGQYESGNGPLCNEKLPYCARCLGTWLHRHPLVCIFVIGLTLTLAGGLIGWLCLGTAYSNGAALGCGLGFLAVLLLSELKILIRTRLRQR